MLLLLACTGPDKPGDDTAAPADDTAATDDTAPPADDPTLADAEVTFVGAAQDGAASALSGLGDTDGDGAPDLAVAAFYGNEVCAWSGPVAPGAHPMDEGTCLAGEATYDFFGYALAGVGDLDGDGLTDLAVGAVGSDDAGTEAGEVYLYFGPLVARAASGTSLLGEAPGDFLGANVIGGSDLDGDALPDWLVAATGNDANGGGGGRVYLVSGVPEPGERTITEVATATLTGVGGSAALMHGSSTGGDALGEAMAVVGDVDGDGLDDLLLGGSGSDQGGADAGIAWLVFGPVSGSYGVEDADTRFVGPGPSAYVGGAVTGPGDLDGDGLADLAVAADGWEEGRVYLLSAPAPGDVDLAGAERALAGSATLDEVGWSLASPGDLDGDGRPDLLVGVPGLDGVGEDAGAAWLVTGIGEGVQRLGEVGVVIQGEAAGDSAGRALGLAGDTDEDGVTDVLVGALYNQEGGVFAGKGYLLSGAALVER